MRGRSLGTAIFVTNALMRKINMNMTDDEYQREIEVATKKGRAEAREQIKEDLPVLIKFHSNQFHANPQLFFPLIAAVARGISELIDGRQKEDDEDE